MSRRMIVLALVIGLVELVSVRPVAADPGSGQQPSGDSNSDTGVIAATAGQEFTGGAGASSSKPRCWYQVADVEVIDDTGVGVDEEYTRPNPSTGMPETLYVRHCPEGDSYVWVPVVDVDDLIDDASDRVSTVVPFPETNMNPDPAVGGLVNVGLWLAVTDPGPVSVTAAVGPVWATVTAVYQRTTWEMGNGDVVECDGLGVPIVDWNTAEQGPCGYTYRWPSAPKFTGTDDLAYHASVTGHWLVTFTTSTGRSGSLDPIERTTEFNYQVREIQTVGVAG